MKFIHIADIHLGMIPDQGKPWSEVRKNEIVQSFYNIIERCIREKIDLLLIAGDLFHRAPLLRELKELNYQFSKLNTTTVILMAGNHDYISDKSHYNQFVWDKHVIMLDQEQMSSVYISGIDTRIYGFSYRQRDILDGRYDHVRPEGDAGIHILLAHGGDEKNIPINKKLLKEAGFDYVALGHIHKPEWISDTVAYAGSLEPLDKNEIGQHGFILGEIKNKKEHNMVFVSNSIRRYMPITIEVEPDMTKGMLYDMLQSYITNYGKEHIYRILLTGIRSNELQFEETEFDFLGNIVDVQDGTIPDYDFESLRYQNRDNMIGLFIDAIRQCGESDEIADKALYYGIEALLKADR